MPAIERLRADYEPRGVRFWLVFVDPSESVAAIRTHLNTYDQHASAIRDPRHELVRMTGATPRPRRQSSFTKGQKPLDLSRPHRQPLRRHRPFAAESHVARSSERDRLRVEWRCRRDAANYSAGWLHNRGPGVAACVLVPATGRDGPSGAFAWLLPSRTRANVYGRRRADRLLAVRPMSSRRRRGPFPLTTYDEVRGDPADCGGDRPALHASLAIRPRTWRLRR